MDLNLQTNSVCAAIELFLSKVVEKREASWPIITTAV